MKHSHPKITLTFLTVFTLTFSASAQLNSTQKWTKADAAVWFKSRVWANGLKLNVSETVDKQEFARQYTANKAYWEKAFAYLRDNDLPNVPVGKQVLDSGHVSVAITENPTKPLEETGWESHVKNIDVQYVAVGAEKMGEVKVPDAKLTERYNPAKDAAHYEAEGKFYEARPGTIFIFFPNDAHRVNVKADGVDQDKKIVIKITAAP